MLVDFSHGFWTLILRSIPKEYVRVPMAESTKNCLKPHAETLCRSWL